MTDHYFAFIKAQAGWYKEFMFPLLSLFRRGDLATQFNSVYTILFMLLAIVMAKKLPLSLNVLIWIKYIAAYDIRFCSLYAALHLYHIPIQYLLGIIFHS